MPLPFNVEFPILHWTAVGATDHAESLGVAKQSLRDLARVVEANTRLLSGRMALVAERPLLRGTSRMFAVYVEEHGADARVFGAKQEALAWLVAPIHPTTQERR